MKMWWRMGTKFHGNVLRERMSPRPANSFERFVRAASDVQGYPSVWDVLIFFVATESEIIMSRYALLVLLSVHATTSAPTGDGAYTYTISELREYMYASLQLV